MSRIFTNTRKYVLASLLTAFLFSGSTLSAETLASSKDGFQPLELASTPKFSAEILDVVKPYLKGVPEGLEGRQSLNLAIKKHENGYRVDIIKSGYLDDSVRGEHFRGQVIQTSKGWQLIEMAVKLDCYRGKASNGRCP